MNQPTIQSLTNLVNVLDKLKIAVLQDVRLLVCPRDAIPKQNCNRDMIGEAQASSGLARTDPKRWRLRSIAGAHRWQYVEPEEADEVPQSCAEKYFLGVSSVSFFLMQSLP